MIFGPCVDFKGPQVLASSLATACIGGVMGLRVCLWTIYGYWKMAREPPPIFDASRFASPELEGKLHALESTRGVALPRPCHGLAMPSVWPGFDIFRIDSGAPRAVTVPQVDFEASAPVPLWMYDFSGRLAFQVRRRMRDSAR